MIVIADTNVLIRFIVRDNEGQFLAAQQLFEKCNEIIISTHTMCELVWVLERGYKLDIATLYEVLETILTSKKTTVKEDEIEAGLYMVRNGGDFADGVIAYTGSKMTNNKTVFASFDKTAVNLLSDMGVIAIVPTV